MSYKVSDDERAKLEARIARHERERKRERAEFQRLFDESPADDYREGFIDGYLRAHDDGDEYACSIKQAELAYGKYLSEGGRTLERADVGGW